MTANNNTAPAFTTAQFIAGLASATGDYTMPSQQLLLLLALYTMGDLPQIDLTKHTGVERSSNSRNIAKLGSGELGRPGKGLVESFEDPADRRTKMVRLTPGGRALIKQVIDNIK